MAAAVPVRASRGQHEESSDDARLDPRLQAKKREMQDAAAALSTQKAKAAQEEVRQKGREAELRATDVQLQQQLARSSKFLQDSEGKRQRAEQREADEALLVKEREEEIERLERQVEESRLACKGLGASVARSRRFEEFLVRARESSAEEYTDVLELVARYEALERAQSDLQLAQDEADERTELAQRERAELGEEQQRRLQETEEKAAELTAALQERRARRRELEQELEEARHEDSSFSLRFRQVLTCVENLFHRCSTSRKTLQHCLDLREEEEAKGKEEDNDAEVKDPSAVLWAQKAVAVAQLSVLQSSLKDFREIAETLRRERRVAAVQPPCAAFAEPEVVFSSAAPDFRGGFLAQTRGSDFSRAGLTPVDEQKVAAAESSFEAA